MIITASDIHKSFGQLKVLKGIDLEVRKGEIVSITGASGAGKSTLLQILGTLSTPDSGSLEIDGTRVDRMSRDEAADFRCRKIGFVFQAHHLLPEFTAEENVMIPAMIAGVPQKKARERAAELISLLGLEERRKHKPSELSGGEQQRIATARALINSPAVLFADEPTGNLDAETAAGIMELLSSLNRVNGTAVMMVTHNLNLCKEYPGRVLVCENESCREYEN